MGTSTVHFDETEQERRELIAELTADYGPTWTEQFKPGTFGCHELLDRTTMATDTIEKFILSHPACVQNPEWFALAEQAAEALRELYQRIGAVHLDEDGD